MDNATTNIAIAKISYTENDCVVFLSYLHVVIVQVNAMLERRSKVDQVKKIRRCVKCCKYMQTLSSQNEDSTCIV